MGSRFAASRTIYVGNLPGDVRERDVEDIFYKYGRIVDIDLKIPPRPPGYAFVEFEDPLDAEDAIRGRDGYDFDGYRLRVEFAHGGRSAAPPMGGGGGYRAGPPRTGGISRRTEYRVIVKNLPSSASWQDLKDHMRKAGDVCFAQVFKDGGGMMGIVDYTNEDDMKYALRKLDDSEFKDRHGTGAYIRVKAESDSKDKDRARSDSRSPDRGRDRGRDRSYSRSPSPKRRRDDDEDDDRGKDKRDRSEEKVVGDKDEKEDRDEGKRKEEDDREDDRRKDEEED